MSTNANAKSSVNVKVRDFCGKSKLFFILSAVLVVLSILSTFLGVKIALEFKGGTIWSVIVDIHGAVQAIGLALLVLFFVVGVVKTCGSFTEVKKPEHALKLFIRFAIAKGAITYGMELMLSLRRSLGLWF